MLTKDPYGYLDNYAFSINQSINQFLAFDVEIRLN